MRLYATMQVLHLERELQIVELEELQNLHFEANDFHTKQHWQDL